MNLLDLFKDWDDVIQFKANREIFAEGAPADAMYIILKGEVELTLHDEPLGAEGPGGIFGEMALINAATRSATATSLTKVTAVRLDRDEFRDQISENPDFALHVMAVLANRLRAINEYMTRQAQAFR